jgi:hypothetical protein
MNNMAKIFVFFITCLLLGVAAGYAYVNFQPTLAQWLLFKPKLYQTDEAHLQNKYRALSPILQVQWSQLLPDNEKSVLEKYQQTQASTTTELAATIFLSLQASTDNEYGDAMISTNSVDTFDNKAVSIAGFIVPVDYVADRSLNHIFIVPYFGACLHFPAPPPNQMIFAHLNSGFTDFDINQAYRLDGIFRRGLFEDPLGTSAYILDVVSIEPYYDNPDNFRRH